MMNVHTYVTATTTYTIVYVRSLSDLMMNVHTLDTDNTTYTMLYVGSLCQIQWGMYTHMLVITLLTPRCMSDDYAWLNDECTNMYYRDHTFLSDNTTYTMVYMRSL